MAGRHGHWPFAVDQHANRPQWQRRLPPHQNLGGAFAPDEDEESTEGSQNGPAGAALPRHILKLPESTLYRCSACQVKINGLSNIPGHVSGQKHKKKTEQHPMENFLRNGYNVEIHCDHEKAKINFQDRLRKEALIESAVNSRVKSIFTIKNLSQKKDITLESCKLPSMYSPFYKICNPVQQPIVIRPGGEFEVELEVHHFKEGLYYTTLTFAVKLGEELGHQVWAVHMKCSLPVLSDKLKQAAPYKRHPVVVQRDPRTSIVLGIRPESNVDNSLETKRKLPAFEPPLYLQSLLNHGFEEWGGISPEQKELLDETIELLEGDLRDDYALRLSRILHIEEAQEMVHLQQFSMDNKRMEKCTHNEDLLKLKSGNLAGSSCNTGTMYMLSSLTLVLPEEWLIYGQYFLESLTKPAVAGTNSRLSKELQEILKVPGLQEGRPSVKRNDEIFVTVERILADDEAPREYKGHVHEVHRDHVVLGFSKGFVEAHYPNRLYHVRFSLNRVTYQYEHQAAFLAEDSQNNLVSTVLFPSHNPRQQPQQQLHGPLDLRYINRQLNEEQKRAVEHIVLATSRPAPYLVFGPPGTGKTMVIVEAIQQVILTVHGSRILLCAPSNTAADLLAVRLERQNRLLEEAKKVKFIRLRSPVTDPDTIPNSIKPDTNYKDPRYYFPSQADLRAYGVVICTLMTAGRLVKAKLPPGFFTDIVIDEAGFATETATLVPIAGILKIKGGLRQQVVLAGDPKQLGPVVHSPIAEYAKFDVSLMERLMDTCDPYSWDETTGYDVQYITQLVRNYRSHEDILHMPNVFFYHKQLKACAAPALKNSLIHCSELPCQGFPLVFHGVIGDNVRESNSPSWFNPQEAIQVVTYVDQLLKDKTLNLHEKDIGVVTPYRKQVDKIKELLIDRYPDYEMVKVGSVENFQGNERKVIILSTVRSHGSSNNEKLENAHKHVGFLKNPKRFNVSITRAQALLIVVGNPHVLKEDHHWRGLLNYCKKKGGYRGCDYSDQNENVVESFFEWAVGEIRSHISDVYDGLFGLHA